MIKGLKIEVIKIGIVIPKTYDEHDTKTTIAVNNNCDNISKYYTSILISKFRHDYNFIKTVDVGRILKSGKFIGVADEEPKIGENFKMNNYSWQTSSVDRVINDNIIITKNSAYALHNISLMRNQKLNKLI